jgi:hypothetical protein
MADTGSNSAPQAIAGDVVTSETHAFDPPVTPRSGAPSGSTVIAQLLSGSSST